MKIESVHIDPINGHIEVYRQHEIQVGTEKHTQTHLEQHFLDNHSVEPCSGGLSVKGHFKGGVKMTITHDGLDDPIVHTMPDYRVSAADVAAEIAAQLNQADETLGAIEASESNLDAKVNVKGDVTVVLENHEEAPVPADVTAVIKAHS